MANLLYNAAKTRFLTWQTSGDAIDMVDDTISVCIVGNGYIPDPYEPDFTAVETNIIGTSINLTNKTVTDGVFFADNVTFLSVTGATVESLVIYKNTGLGSTSVPIAFIDVVASGLPLTPNGGNITVQWNPSGIFSL